MNEIRLNGTQEFMGISIPVIEGGFGENCKCISDKTISEIHGQPNREIRRRILDNIKRFKENVDYIDLNKGVGESHTLDLTQFGYTRQAITQANNIYLLSERGYAKLIKIMDTDLAWEIHDELIDSYFSMRETIKNVLSEKDLAICRIVNAKSDMETALAIRSFESTITAPLLEEVDRYQRFLCEKTGCLTKSELAVKLDTKPQTLAAKLKKVGVYTKTSQVDGIFLKKYPNVKIIVDREVKFTNPHTGSVDTKSEWQWTHDGAKALVDYLVELHMVSFTDNDGFKLVA